MNNLLTILCVLFLGGCTNADLSDPASPATSEKSRLLPLSVTLEGQLKQLKDVGVLTPSVRFDIGDSVVHVQVGAGSARFLLKSAS